MAWRRGAGPYMGAAWRARSGRVGGGHRDVYTRRGGRARRLIFLRRTDLFELLVHKHAFIEEELHIIIVERLDRLLDLFRHFGLKLEREIQLWNLGFCGRFLNHRLYFV